MLSVGLNPEAAVATSLIALFIKPPPETIKAGLKRLFPLLAGALGGARKKFGGKGVTPTTLLSGKFKI